MVRIVATVKEVLSIMAGLLVVFYSVVGYIVRLVNEKQLEAKVIRHCYFDIQITTIDKTQGYKIPVLPMKFYLTDKVSTIKRWFLLKLGLMKKNDDYQNWFSSS
jgi:hypothetical protein